MKKVISPLIIAIQSKVNPMKRCSKTISRYINKIPCPLQELSVPSPASIFIRQQMRDYPSNKMNYKLQSKRQLLLGEKIKLKIELNKQQNPLKSIIIKLQEKVTYLQLQQAKQIIKEMTINQINDNRMQIRKLKSIVNYYLELNQSIATKNTQNHLIETAKQLIKQIKQTHKKKVNQFV